MCPFKIDKSCMQIQEWEAFFFLEKGRSKPEIKLGGKIQKSFQIRENFDVKFTQDDGKES